MIIENAKITSTMFGVEDHGILTFMVHLQGGSWGQGLGGYAIDGGYNKETGRREKGHGAGLIAMRSIIETVGAKSWESLPGTLCRVKRAEYNDKPIIGHIIEDRWFDLEQFMETHRYEQ